MTFTIKHNTLIEGPFPVQQIINIDSKISVQIKITDEPFINEVIITIPVKDTSKEMETVFELGKFVGVYMATKLK